MDMLEKMASLKSENAQLIVENQELQASLCLERTCPSWSIDTEHKFTGILKC